ncbi:MAG: hypothetical protein WCO90_09780 [Planctomycetota bacterium]
MPLPPHTQIDPPAAVRPGQAPVWLPWLLAPAFLLLPMGGCGAAAALRRPTATAAETAQEIPTPGPVAPMTTVVTMVQPRR